MVYCSASSKRQILAPTQKRTLVSDQTNSRLEDWLLLLLLRDHKSVHSGS